MKFYYTTLLLLTLIFNLVNAQSVQEKHLTLIYDFEGEDFDYSVSGMLGVNDSLYIISNTPNGQGQFFRIDGEGAGYEVIWEFDDVNFAPNSIIGNDTVLYGTTRFSSQGGGTVFKYSLIDYTFDFVTEFSSFDVQDIQIKYLTDSVLWLSSQGSINDLGSIFTINKDGSGLNKVYNDFNEENGQNPVDFVFHEGKIYIACFNGGGIPYTDSGGSTVLSGSFIRINQDGTGYENLIKGSDLLGTQPQSIVIQNDKIVGLFAYSADRINLGGQFFRSNLDGTEYDSLGALTNRALTKLLPTDSLVYGISSFNIFGVNPYTAEIRIFDDLNANPEFGYDVVANPAYLNGDVYFATQQGGSDRGGTILKWINEAPEATEENEEGRIFAASSIPSEINLNEIFTDPEGDSLTFSFNYDPALVSVSEADGILTYQVLTDEPSEVLAIASDGWLGFGLYTFTVSGTNVISSIEHSKRDFKIYPNPVSSILRFDEENVNLVEVIGLNGHLLITIENPESEIDVSDLNSGVYILRVNSNGKTILNRFVKK